VMEGYILWATSTSAGSPILYRRFRPVSGELPKGTVIEPLLCQQKICYSHVRFKLMQRTTRDGVSWTIQSRSILPPRVSRTEHRGRFHERLQHCWKLWIVTGADDGWADEGRAIRQQGGRARLSEEKCQKLVPARPGVQVSPFGPMASRTQPPAHLPCTPASSCGPGVARL